MSCSEERNPVPAPEQLGDYRLLELLSEGARTGTYHAKQISVGREVVLERIKAGFERDEEIVELFLADVRAKAGIDYPGIGSVYEAVRGDEAVFYARELLPGPTFEELHEAEATFKPAVVAAFLRQVAGAMDYLTGREIATLPLEPRHLILSPHEVLRIANLAAAAEPDSVVDHHDRHLVSELLFDMLAEGAPGATRMRELLSHLAGGESEGEGGRTALPWNEIYHRARMLEHDLSEGAKVATQLISTGKAEGAPLRPLLRTALTVMLSLVVVAALAAGGFLLTNRKSAPPARDLSAMVEIPAGRYQTHDGKTRELAGFWIDAHEVSIGEYAAFLEALSHLPENKRTGYDHGEQPPLKRDHVPDRWEAVLSTARIGGLLDGLPVDLNCPATGIDWWDAQAYANWKGGRLPTQEQWLAATQNEPVLPAGWGPVDTLSGDVTSRGVHGLAGNVAEWMRDPVKNPAFPMNPKRPVVCGASFLRPHNGARARNWPSSREVRRNDLGFRLVREVPPQPSR